MGLNINKWLPKRGTAATMNNVVLGPGEFFYEIDTKRWKQGDGTTLYQNLPYEFDRSVADALYATSAQGLLAVSALQPEDLLDGNGILLSSVLPTIPGQAVPVGFSWAYSSGGDNPMTSGTATFEFVAPFAGALKGVHVQQDDYHSTVATIVDIETKDIVSGNWISAYGANPKPTITAGQTAVDAGAPTGTTVTKGQLIRGRLVQAPPTATAGGAAASKVYHSPGYGEGATTKSTTHTITMPTAANGAQTGDVVLMIVANGAMDTATSPLPATWRTIASLVTNPTAKQTTRIIAAPWTSSLANTFQVDTQIALVAEPILLRGVNIDDLGQIVFSDGVENTGVANAATPSFTASTAADFAIVFVAAQFPPGADGYRNDWSGAGGPATLSKAVDILTAQGATVIDYSLAVGFTTAAVAAGATFPSQPVVLSGGTSGGNTTTVRGVILVKRSAGSHGPARIVATWTLENS